MDCQVSQFAKLAINVRQRLNWLIAIKAGYPFVEIIDKKSVVVIEYLKKSRNIRAFSHIEI